MKMKKFINNPDTLTDELLEGMELANHDIVEVRDHMVISRALAGADRVTIVTYGGSGHEPAQHGFVGEGRGPRRRRSGLSEGIPGLGHRVLP